MTRAPASITSATCAPRRAKSADRIDGATWRSPKRSRALIGRLHRGQHRVTAVLAEHVLGGAHADDRLVLAAVGALRDQLVAPQAVDAPVAAGELGRAKPRLAAARACGPLESLLTGLHLGRLQAR